VSDCWRLWLTSAPGESVTSVALDVGYDSPSAFTAMFRRELGAAPRRYLRWADQEIVLR
jgi:AraC-like DNA-binding protein